MSGAHRTWTPEQRAAQRERLAVRRRSEAFEQARVDALRAPAVAGPAAERMREKRRDPVFNAAQARSSAVSTPKRAEAIRRFYRDYRDETAAVLAERERLARAPIPPGYEDVFEYLRTRLDLSEIAAKEIVALQAASDAAGRRIW